MDKFRDVEIAWSDIEVAASQTITETMVLNMNADGRWQVCPTNYATGITGLAMKAITTIVGETNKKIPVMIRGRAQPTFDGVADEGQSIGPSATTAGRVMGIAALDEPAAWAEATSQAELNKIMKKKGAAIVAAADGVASEVYWDGLAGV